MDRLKAREDRRMVGVMSRVMKCPGLSGDKMLPLVRIDFQQDKAGVLRAQPGEKLAAHPEGGGSIRRPLFDAGKRKRDLADLLPGQ